MAFYDWRLFHITFLLHFPSNDIALYRCRIGNDDDDILSFYLIFFSFSHEYILTCRCHRLVMGTHTHSHKHTHTYIHTYTYIHVHTRLVSSYYKRMWSSRSIWVLLYRYVMLQYRDYRKVAFTRRGKYHDCPFAHFIAL